MAISLEHRLATIDRKVTSSERDGRGTVVVQAARTYATDALDLWDAVTNPERIARWFLPVSGDLRLGGRYKLEGNAEGTIEECSEPERLALTWEFNGGMSWVRVRLVPLADGTRLELEHESEPYPGFTDTFGPGAVGVGWDLGLVGLAEHLDDPTLDTPLEMRPDWAGSPKSLAAYRASSDAWGRADIAFGTPNDQAIAAAEATRAFYCGEQSMEELIGGRGA